MGLVLNLRAGEDFYLNEERVLVKEILDRQHIVLETEDGTLWEVVDDRATEIAPNVMVSVGDRSHQNQARLTIEAPKSISIVRGSVLEAQR